MGVVNAAVGVVESRFRAMGSDIHLIVVGGDGSVDLVDELTAAITVDHDGRITASGGFAAFLGGVPLPATIGRDHQ